MRRYWLFKSEPETFSIQHLAAAPGKRTSWEGVRNYQARNMLRDEIQKGDGVLFYHSRIDPMVIVGTADVVRGGYPDNSATVPEHKYFDPKSTRENPVWFMVDIRLNQVFQRPVTRDSLSRHAETADMMVLKKGSRLSIQPVTEAQWLAVHELAGAKP